MNPPYNTSMNSTSIPPSMRGILGLLLFGICAVSANIALFIVLLIMGVNTGLGFKKNIANLLENHLEWVIGVGSLELLLLILWPTLFCYFVYKHDRQLIGLIKQFIIGWCVIMAFIAIIAVLILLALYHDGKLGSVATFIMGLLTSPFTMELILCSIGVTLVIILNTIRQKLSGDEYVEMEVPEHIKSSSQS